MGLIRPIIVTALTLVILSWALPSISYGNLTTLLAASVVIMLLQKIVKPILNLLLLPINIVTLGLFSGAINVFIIWLATALVPGFHIEPMVIMGIELNYFLSLLLVSFLLSLVQSFIAILF
jgi:putative membrane protein